MYRSKDLSRLFHLDKEVEITVSPDVNSAIEKKKQFGTLRHVGLTESMHMIASRMGWHLDKTEDILTPVIAKSDIITDSMNLKNA